MLQFDYGNIYNRHTIKQSIAKQSGNILMMWNKRRRCKTLSEGIPLDPPQSFSKSIISRLALTAAQPDVTHSIGLHWKRNGTHVANTTLPEHTCWFGNINRLQANVRNNSLPLRSAHNTSHVRWGICSKATAKTLRNWQPSPITISCTVFANRHAIHLRPGLKDVFSKLESKAPLAQWLERWSYEA